MMTVPLCAETIYANLCEQVQQQFVMPNAIEVLEKTSSTQQYLKEKLKKNANVTLDKNAGKTKGALAKEKDQSQFIVKPMSRNFNLVVAESQSAGVGRSNRSWQASSESNVLMSFSWEYECIPKDLAGLSLALVLGLLESLKAKFSLSFSIKWPNDLLLSGKKIAGLIVDMESAKSCKVIVGLGLNVCQDLGDTVIDQDWTDLAKEGVIINDRNELIAAILEGFYAVIHDYSKVGFRGYQEKWNAHAEHRGKKVKLFMRSSNLKTSLEPEVVGVLHGVNEQGFLLVKTQEGMRTITDANYSMRLYT